MASTILDYKSVAAPSLKSGAGESLFKAAGSDIANAGKLFQDEMARRAEMDLKERTFAEQQATNARQAGLDAERLNLLGAQTDIEKRKLSALEAEAALQEQFSNLINSRFAPTTPVNTSIPGVNDAIATPQGTVIPSNPLIPGMSDTTAAPNGALTGNVPISTSTLDEGKLLGLDATYNANAFTKGQPTVTPQQKITASNLFNFSDNELKAYAIAPTVKGPAGTAFQRQMESQAINRGMERINSFDLSTSSGLNKANTFLSSLNKELPNNPVLVDKLRSELQPYINAKHTADMAIRDTQNSEYLNNINRGLIAKPLTSINEINTYLEAISSDTNKTIDDAYKAISGHVDTAIRNIATDFYAQNGGIAAVSADPKKLKELDNMFSSIKLPNSTIKDVISTVKADLEQQEKSVLNAAKARTDELEAKAKADKAAKELAANQAEQAKRDASWADNYKVALKGKETEGDIDPTAYADVFNLFEPLLRAADGNDPAINNRNRNKFYEAIAPISGVNHDYPTTDEITLITPLFGKVDAEFLQGKDAEIREIFSKYFKDYYKEK